MHTEHHHTEARRSMAPEAHDDHRAKLHRDRAAEHPRPAHPLREFRDYPPNCVHGMSSLADSGYELALARLRRG